MDAATVAKMNTVRQAFTNAVMAGYTEWMKSQRPESQGDLAGRIWEEITERGDVIWVGYTPDHAAPEMAIGELDANLERALETVLVRAGLPEYGYPLERDPVSETTYRTQLHFKRAMYGDRGDLSSDLGQAARRVLVNAGIEPSSPDPEAEPPESIQRRLAETAPDALAFFRSRSVPVEIDEATSRCGRCGVVVQLEGYEGHRQWHESLTIGLDLLAGLIITTRERSS